MAQTGAVCRGVQRVCAFSPQPRSGSQNGRGYHDIRGGNHPLRNAINSSRSLAGDAPIHPPSQRYYAKWGFYSRSSSLHSLHSGVHSAHAPCPLWQHHPPSTLRFSLIGSHHPTTSANPSHLVHLYGVLQSLPGRATQTLTYNKPRAFPRAHSSSAHFL